MANFWGNNIQKFTPDGVGSLFASVGPQSTNAQFSSLRYLFFDSAGNLYATHYGNQTIMKFAPDGAGSVFANVGSIGMRNPNGIVIQSVPEPSSFAILGLGLIALLVWRGRCSAS